MLRHNLQSIVEQWTGIVGAEFVQCDSSALRSAETATFATRQTIPAIIRPGTLKQVQECVRAANQFKAPIYPLSSGKNWGYGSRVPPVDGCALLDLSRMNRIVDFSEDLAYVTVQPGVTQKQLYEFLRERNSHLWMDATGSSPDCSLIGNAMERGFGHTPYGDHFNHVCGLQVVLPTGEVIETGAARFPGSTTAAVSKWGVGPSLDGLFSQSNLGIVTRMSVWLMPAPEAFEAFFFRCESPEGLPGLIDALRDLRLREVLRSSIHVANDYKVLGGLRQYPWAETNGGTPLRPELMATFRRQMTFGVWNASGGIYGTPRQVAEAKRLLRERLQSQPGKLKFLSEKTLRLAKRFARPFNAVSGWDISRTVELVEPVLGLMRGVPTKQSLASIYWRKKMAAPADPDPDRDRCGLLWYAPVAPADGATVARLTELTTRTLLKFGFEPAISLTLLTARAVSYVISINYDRDVEGEDEKAMACYEELVRLCHSEGFYPYRLGIQSMGESDGEGSYEALMRALKHALDPNGVLAPGRYGRKD